MTRRDCMQILSFWAVFLQSKANAVLTAWTIMSFLFIDNFRQLTNSQQLSVGHANYVVTSFVGKLPVHWSLWQHAAPFSTSCDDFETWIEASKVNNHELENSFASTHQILICRSVRQSACAISMRLRRVK